MKVKYSIITMILLGLFASPTSADTTPAIGNLKSMSLYLTIGYYFQIENEDPIVLTRATDSSDPFRTYEGCRITNVTSNFNVILVSSIKATSKAEGRWTVTTKPSAIPKGTTKIEICVRGENLQIENLSAGIKVKVAEVTLGVISQGT